MRSERNLGAVEHALYVALLFITSNRVLSFIFIVLALIIGFWGMALIWEFAFRALL